MTPVLSMMEIAEEPFDDSRHNHPGFAVGFRTILEHLVWRHDLPDVGARSRVDLRTP